MRKTTILTGFLLITLALQASGQEGRITGFRKIRWDRERIAPGLIWRYSYAILNDSVPQNINILMVNLNKRSLSINYIPGQNIPLSRQVSGTDALAAVNGGFFNVKNGGSVTYIRTSGRIAETDTARKWSRNSNMNGSVLIRSRSRVRIETARPNSWYDLNTCYEDVLLTGPLMVKAGKMVMLPATPLVINRHPRTAIGVRNHRKIILLTVDGRTKEAHGMTISELADLMFLLGCRDAVNLDGGGSTTMWISGKDFNGVVNMPCDNKKFDHEGERAISDAFIVR